MGDAKKGRREGGGWRGQEGGGEWTKRTPPSSLRSEREASQECQSEAGSGPRGPVGLAVQAGASGPGWHLLGFTKRSRTSCKQDTAVLPGRKGEKRVGQEC